MTSLPDICWAISSVFICIVLGVMAILAILILLAVVVAVVTNGDGDVKSRQLSSSCGLGKDNRQEAQNDIRQLC